MHNFFASPGLVYGRTMGGAHETSEGLALMRLDPAADAAAAGRGTLTGLPVVGALTYRLPRVSAQMVPRLQAFMTSQMLLGGGASADGPAAGAGAGAAPLQQAAAASKADA